MPVTESQAVSAALGRLHRELGYDVTRATDGVDEFIIPGHLGPAAKIIAALGAADGAEEASFKLVRPGHHCSVYVVWGNGPDEVIADASADSDAELEAISQVIWPSA